jgi:hypothetical protein
MQKEQQTQLFQEPAPGTPVDVVPFGRFRVWSSSEGIDLNPTEIGPDENGWIKSGLKDVNHLGIEWLEPRDIRTLAIKFADISPLPQIIKAQYWRNHWPTIAPERKPGGARGWISQDDPWNGQWTTIRGEIVQNGMFWSIVCDPIDFPELGARNLFQQINIAENYLVRFRRTLKVRLVFDHPSPVIVESILAQTPARWEARKVKTSFLPSGETELDWSGQVRIYNGILRRINPTGFEADDSRIGIDSWQCKVSNHPKGVGLELLNSCGEAASGGQTIVTLETQTRSFSFRPADLDLGPIHIPEYSIAIENLDDDIVSERKLDQPTLSTSIYDRIDLESEQSLRRAMAETPSLDPRVHDSYTGLGRYLPLGIEASKQTFALRFNGELFIDKRHLKLLGRDAARLIWPSHQIRYRFGCGDPPDFREHHPPVQTILDGWLPVVLTNWNSGNFSYQQTAFAAPLINGILTDEKLRGDEDLACYLRFEIQNTSDTSDEFRVALDISPQEEIILANDKLISHGRIVPGEAGQKEWRLDLYERPVLRAVMLGKDQARFKLVSSVESQFADPNPNSVLLCLDTLQPGETKTLDFAIPFPSFADAQEWESTSAHGLDAQLDRTIEYWQSEIRSGAKFNLPDKILSDFHKAVQTHIAISVSKDPVSGLNVVPAASWTYGACGNEACWQIRFLDQTGHHQRAASYLDTFLHTQGMEKPDGLFSSSVGAFQGLDLDSGVAVRSDYSFRYNLDHGVILACLADHYRYCADLHWLKKAAPNLISGCEFITRERQATKTVLASGDKSPAWGLLPAGDLEDNPEWFHWFAVNAHAYAGMRSAALALADFQTEVAEKIAAEARAYREEIRQAVRLAMINAPVVRLRDGTCIPHIPARTGIRGRELGWFREAADGAIQLLEGGVFDPGEEEITWILKDLEDNLFISTDWGHAINIEADWFSQGGFTIQPNLIDLGIDYLRRGQIKHALRALFNNFAVSLYPGVRAFAEHAVEKLGRGVGPFYKSSDEAKSLLWLRDYLLREDDEELHLASGAPRAWFAAGESFRVERAATFFGPVSFQIVSDESEVSVEIELSEERAPRDLILHLRPFDQKPLQTLTINSKRELDFQPGSEQIHIPNPPARIHISAQFDA